VTVVGSGLAVSSLTSAIVAEPVQSIFAYYHLKNYQQTWYGNPASLLFLNVLFHSLVGILSAILVAVVAKEAIEKFIRFLGDRVRKRRSQ
jgi:small-conductance mechanosensitive channel